MGHLLRGEKKHPNNIFGFKTYPAYPWPFLYDVVLESNSNKPLWFIWDTTGHLSMSGNLCIIWHYDSSKNLIDRASDLRWVIAVWVIVMTGGWWPQARGHRADGQWPGPGVPSTGPGSGSGEDRGRARALLTQSPVTSLRPHIPRDTRLTIRKLQTLVKLNVARLK